MVPSLKESVSFLFKIIWKQSTAFTSIKKFIYFTQ